MRRILLRRSLVYTGDLILVNGQHPYHENADRRALLSIGPASQQVFLAGSAVRALSRLMKALPGREWITAVSGWRSLEEQKQLYAQSLQDNGQAFTEQFVARPGHSEHQTGLAIDLALKQEHIDPICPAFPYTGICQIFRRRAAAYGLIERYPHGKKAVTGIAHEPWHFRYVGVPHAAIMTERRLTLEEYLALLRCFPYGGGQYLRSRTKPDMAVSFLPAAEEGDTLLELDNAVSYSISGNNVDGFILTMRRR